MSRLNFVSLLENIPDKMDNLKILTVQSDISWENKKENLSHFFSLIDKKAINTDIIIFPEMFSTGFSMNINLAEPMNGETVKWLKQVSKEKDTLIITSLIIKENRNFFNRLIVVFPDGNIAYYDKRHLFTLIGEQKYYSKGKKQLVIERKGWRIMPLICYDLRFPVWSRNTMKYDLLIFVANWPERRRKAWQSLLIARAIENVSYVAGVNRIGYDNNNVKYAGDTVVLNYAGDKISQTKPYEEKVKLITLDYQDMVRFRTKFKFLDDADVFHIRKT